tara:strand:- start:21 stop:320 length:300 start_codon:yes stop_codon:yes gene_type:complete
MAWIRDNATTLIGWAVVASLALGSRFATVDATQASVTATQRDVAGVTVRVAAVEQDVALLQQGLRQQEAIVARQESAQRELDRLVIELRTVVKVGRDGH